MWMISTHQCISRLPGILLVLILLVWPVTTNREDDITSRSPNQTANNPTNQLHNQFNQQERMIDDQFNNQAASQPANQPTGDATSPKAKYIELDHNLVPGTIENINEHINLPGRQQNRSVYGNKQFRLNKYDVEKKNMLNILTDKDEEDFESVLGTSEEVFYDHDLGLFSTIVTCYNNHWTLRTSPDDWWNVIVRNIAQAIDKNGNKTQVRQHFVRHEGKKRIQIVVPGSLDSVDYSWLFNQFSQRIRDNIKKPEYVDIMQADFSTTLPYQAISTQIMLMSSLQKYFSFGFSTACGIPGVEMLGSDKDWQRLIEKTKNIKKILAPIMSEIGLEKWFKDTLDMLDKLLDTYRGSPDKEWWGHVLSWNEIYGSGAREWWSGWIVDFLTAGGGVAEKPGDFQSGLVSVPVEISDVSGVEDTGKLVGGTVGFQVDHRKGERAPVVQARQGWALLMPRNSPITPLLKG